MDRPSRRIVFEPEFDDRAATLRMLFEIDEIRPLIRRCRLRALLFWSLLLVVFLAGSALLTTLVGVPLRSPFYGMIATIIVLWCVSRAYRYTLSLGVTRRFADTMFDSARGWTGPGIDGGVAVEIADDALSLSSGFSVERFRWPCIRTIKRSDLRGLVQLIDGRCFAVPVRAFDCDPQRLHAFLDEMVRLDTDAGGWDAAVAQFLRSFRSKCRGCGYELHGVSSARCPECGRPIVHTDFRSAWTERVTPFDPAAFQPVFTTEPQPQPQPHP